MIQIWCTIHTSHDQTCARQRVGRDDVLGDSLNSELPSTTVRYTNANIVKPRLNNKWKCDAIVGTMSCANPRTQVEEHIHNIHTYIQS